MFVAVTGTGLRRDDVMTRSDGLSRDGLNIDLLCRAQATLEHVKPFILHTISKHARQERRQADRAPSPEGAASATPEEVQCTA